MPVFELGQIVISTGAQVCLADNESEVLLDRHRKGDWGYVTMVEKCMNEFAVEDGIKITSHYRTSQGFDVLVITDGDRSKTTILLPQEAT
jgi:hypothetical protein